MAFRFVGGEALTELETRCKHLIQFMPFAPTLRQHASSLSKRSRQMARCPPMPLGDSRPFKPP